MKYFKKFFTNTRFNQSSCFACDSSYASIRYNRANESVSPHAFAQSIEFSISCYAIWCQPLCLSTTRRTTCRANLRIAFCPLRIPYASGMYIVPATTTANRADQLSGKRLLMFCRYCRAFLPSGKYPRRVFARWRPYEFMIKSTE